MLWKWLQLVPNTAMIVVLLHQLVDVADSGTGKMWEFFKEHPWYVFTAVASVVLTSAHVFLFATKKMSTSWKIKPIERKQLEILLYSVDGAWGFLWVLQVIVQQLLPEDHRAFQIGELVVILVLYAVQTALDAMSVYYLYYEWRDGLTGANYEAVPQDDGQELVGLVSLRRPASSVPNATSHRQNTNA